MIRILAFLVFVLGGLAFQSKPKVKRIFIDDFVECYYPNELKSPLYIYDSYQGEIIDTLENQHNRQWYKLALRQSKPDNWFELEHLLSCPTEPVREYLAYEGAWVCTAELTVRTGEMMNGYTFNLYSEPDENSAVSYVVTEYTQAKIMAVDGMWAKVKFDAAVGLQIGWMSRWNQCGVPWTTCNYGFD